MFCTLHAFGNNFQVDSFLAELSFPQFKVFRKADGQPLSKTHLIVTVSEKKDLSDQINDAISFLRLYENALKQLLLDHGVEEIFLAFSLQQTIYYKETMFPEELCELALSKGISLNICESDSP